MTDYAFSFGSSGYLIMLALLLFARGMDFLSTWVATPTLALEGNPIAKKMGWKLGALVNLVICFAFATWLTPAIIIITAGLLVAAHNFRNAWLMRTLGEEEYRAWYGRQIARVPLTLYACCLLGETILTALLGVALLLFSSPAIVPMSIGLGIIAYSAIVLIYTGLSVYRLRKKRFSGPLE